MVMKSTDTEKIKQMRFDRFVRMMSLYKADLARRLGETRKLFGRKVLSIDIHIHSNHSDGKGTVKDIYDSMKNAGLDFVFVTDHTSLQQKRAMRKLPNMSWGQEPVSRDSNRRHWMHHIGLLCGRRRFYPRCDSTAADFERARQIAPFVWIPHPVGWGNTWAGSNWYPEAWVRALWTLGDEFAMEVMNGAGKLVRAYDAFDQKAIEVWDRLLCDGKKVTALGGTDAHVPDSIGTVWSGVFAPQRRASSIIKTLKQGRCFASEASLIDFWCNGQPMGQTVRRRKGAAMKLSFRVADSAGIASIRIISRGKIVKEIDVKAKSVLQGKLSIRLGSEETYYRLESTASDDRRAFSTPIYVKPTK